MPGDGDSDGAPSEIPPALAILGIERADEPGAEPHLGDEVTGPEEEGPVTPLQIRVSRLGRVRDLPEYALLLTKRDTRYLKEVYLKRLDGYERIEKFDTFFAERFSLEKGRYGSVFYICRGAPDGWKKIYVVTLLNRDGIEVNEVNFELKPVEEIPESRRGRGGGRSKYDPILDRFLEGGNEVVEVVLRGVNPKTAVVSLAKRVEKRHLRVEVGYMDEVLYLKRL